MADKGMLLQTKAQMLRLVKRLHSMRGANVSTEVYMKEVVQLKEEIEELLGDNKQLITLILDTTTFEIM